MTQQPKFKINKAYLFGVNSILFIFNKIFRVKANLPKHIKNINTPYLLICNHIGTYDPFIISYFLKKSPHFVSSDAVLRDPLIGFLFKKLGVIPKRKNVRDSQVIRDMVTAVRDGGAIGLFPEGMRTWTGTTLPFDPVIAKLVKLLNIPVVTAKMKGMQLSNPRWGLKLRRSAVEIDYNLAFTKEQIEVASLEEILEKVTADISHDEVDYQRTTKQTLHSNHRAEYIEHVLFLCSSCESIGKMISEGNDFHCQQCGHKTHVNQYGFFETKADQKLLFDNIRDHYNWQRNQFEIFIKNHLEAKTSTVLFEDKDMLIYKEIDYKMVLQGKATLSFYIDHILIDFEDGKQDRFYLKDIGILNPQFHEKIEVSHLDQNYRFVGETLKISGLKWELACSVYWEANDEGRKISAYLK